MKHVPFWDWNTKRKRSTVKNVVLGRFAGLSPSLVLTAVIILCASSAGVLLYLVAPDSFLLFGDAVSHIVRSRQFIDSQQTGLINIGTVWLPLPHLMLIPFVSIDALFYSGTAGAFLGIPLLLFSAVLLFHLLEQMTGSVRSAFFITVLFALNPNIIYIALTPMSEMPLLFFLLLGAFSLLRFIRSNRLRWGIISSVAVAAATLCRYEAWILAPFLSVVILSGGKSRQVQSAPFLWHRSLLTAVIPWSGIIFWFGWNWFIYDDPLKFAHWTFDVGTSSVRISLQESPQEIVRLLGTAVLWIFGPVMSLAGLLMLFSLRRLNRHREQIVILIFFALPMLFTTAAIIFGFVQMDRWWWNWRFVLPFGLFLAAASALTLAEIHQRFPSAAVFRSIVILCCLVPAAQMLIPSFGIALYQDALKSYDARSRSAASFGQEMSTDYHGGEAALMTAYGSGQRIMINSGLPLKNFSVRYFGGASAASSVPRTERYIIIGKQRSSDPEEFSEYWKKEKDSLLRTYSVVRQDRFFVLLKHRTAFKKD
jgi:hypothetical protein